MIAFLSGVLLDWLIGDPMHFPHPIRWIGAMIIGLTKGLLGPYLKKGRNEKKEKRNGILLVLIVTGVTVLVASLVVVGTYLIHPHLGMLVEAILTCYLLAARSLSKESMKVKKALEKDGLREGQQAVAMIVGRDTRVLDETGVIKAAVETVAENTSDGVIAPLLYAFCGGPILGFWYKAINTMDSMVGYHNDKYESFGWCAAKLDDIVNFLPARVSAIGMILAAFLLGKTYSGREALRIYKRDRYQHKSPNSAQTESACAGALKIQLAGDAYYFGKLVKKPYIGDDIRAIELDDIRRAGVLMYATEIVLLLVLCVIGALGILLQAYLWSGSWFR